MTDTPEGATTTGVTPPRTAFTVREVATILNRSYWQVSNLCRTGRLGSFKAGKHVRIPVDAIAEYRRITQAVDDECTPREAAESLGLPYRQVLELCRTGELSSTRHGTHLRISVDALTEYVARAAANPAA